MSVGKLDKIAQILAEINVKQLRDMFSTVQGEEDINSGIVGLIRFNFRKFQQLTQILDPSYCGPDLLMSQLEEVRLENQGLKEKVSDLEQQLNACFTELSEQRVINLNNGILIEQKDATQERTQTKLQKATEECDALRRQLHGRNQAQDQRLEAAYGQFKQEKNEWKNQMEDEHKRNAELQAQLRIMAEELSDLKKQYLQTCKEYDSKITAQKDYYLKMEEKYISKLDSGRVVQNQQMAQLIDLRQQTEKYKGELNSINDNVKNKEQGLHDAINQYKQKLKSAQHKITKLQEQNQCLQNDIESKSDGAVNQIVQQHELEINDFNLKIHDLKKQMEKQTDLIEQLKAIRTEQAKRIIELEQQNKQAISETDKQEYINAIHMQRDKINDLKKQIRQYEQGQAAQVSAHPQVMSTAPSPSRKVASCDVYGAYNAHDKKVEDLRYQQFKTDFIQQQKQRLKTANLLNVFVLPQKRPKSSLSTPYNYTKIKEW